MTAMPHMEKLPDQGNKFHWLFIPECRTSSALYDTKIMETQNFVVMPTKGSIVPGWVLVVPKFPVPRMADIPEPMFDELRGLVERIIKDIEVKFGKAFTFEHGGFKGSSVSCGVDQAHLHIAPAGFDLVEIAQDYTKGCWMPAGANLIPRSSFTDREYWFVSSGEISLYKEIDQPISQFFRKLIAQHTGNSAHWNYKDNDFIENVALTLEAMATNGR